VLCKKILEGMLTHGEKMGRRRAQKGQKLAAFCLLERVHATSTATLSALD
jgi:hypothetical protein